MRRERRGVSECATQKVGRAVLARSRPPGRLLESEPISELATGRSPADQEIRPTFMSRAAGVSVPWD